jgi:hypothetical protein
MCSHVVVVVDDVVVVVVVVVVVFIVKSHDSPLTPQCFNTCIFVMDGYKIYELIALIEEHLPAAFADEVEEE